MVIISHLVDKLKVEQSITIAADLDVNMDMVYAIAAYHDTGLTEDSKTHHLVSGKIVREDMWLRDWFSEEQIETMAQACEDHRASSDYEARSIYGKYAEGGYLRLWFYNSPNVTRLNALREIIKDEQLLRKKFDYLYDTLSTTPVMGRTVS